MGTWDHGVLFEGPRIPMWVTLLSYSFLTLFARGSQLDPPVIGKTRFEAVLARLLRVLKSSIVTCSVRCGWEHHGWAPNVGGPVEFIQRKQQANIKYLRNSHLRVPCSLRETNNSWSFVQNSSYEVKVKVHGKLLPKSRECTTVRDPSKSEQNCICSNLFERTLAFEYKG